MDYSPSEREPSPDWLSTFKTPLKDFSTLSSSSPSSSSHDATLDEVREGSSVKAGDQKETGRQYISGFVTGIVDLDSDDDKDEETKIFSTRGKSTKKKKLQQNGQKDAELAISQIQKRKEPKRELEHLPEMQTHLTDEMLGNLEGTMQGENDDKADIKTMFTGSKAKKGDVEMQHDAVLQEDDAEGQERRTKRVPSTLPLVFGDKVHRSKVLLECEGDALDLSGDVGAVGRFSVSTPHEKDVDVLLDLKGVIYKAKIVPSNTFFVVSIGQSEAKVEALMSDFIQLQPNANIYETETMVEGTLEGFIFDSDDDGEGAPVMAPMAAANKADDESEDGEKPPKKKIKFDKALKNKTGLSKKTVKAGTFKVGAKGGSTRKTKSAGKSPKKAAGKSPKKAAGKTPKKATISKKLKMIKKSGK